MHCCCFFFNRRQSNTFYKESVLDCRLYNKIFTYIFLSAEALAQRSMTECGDDDDDDDEEEDED